MCGIFGVVYKEKSAEITERWARKVTASMTHRGPDEDGVYVDGNVALGHRRLSIIDLSGGRQPIFNEDGSIGIVFNGEIYNYKAIQQKLMSKGRRFKTKSDTEVILRSYEEWGADCVNRLQGMFAFAIYDRNKMTLFLSRDRLGIKPLYYFENDQALVFASEIKAIFKSGLVRPLLNDARLDFYFSLGYTPGPETLFNRILKLPPGHSLWFENGKTTIERYWSLDGIEKSDAPIEALQERLRALLLEAVEGHLMSEVPLGVFLSGGIDSSAIVACVHRLRRDPINTFSVGYKDAADLSELSYADLVAKKFGTRHHELILSPESFFDGIDSYLDHMEEPVVEAAGIALMALSKMAKEHATVLLCGEGADELFAGYPIYPRTMTMERLRRLSSFLPVRALSCLSFLISEKAMKYFDWLALPLESRYQSLSSDITPSMRAKIYRPEARRRFEGSVERFFENYLAGLRGNTPLEKMLRTDIQYWLPDDLLLKADKMTMAASIELRVPFLDHRLVEFAATLPDDYKLRGKQGKYILKKALEPFLPNEILYRPKRGFPVPISEWIQGNLYDPVSSALLDSKSFILDIFERRYVERILNRHRAGKEDFGKRIFSLYLLERWRQKFIQD